MNFSFTPCAIIVLSCFFMMYATSHIDWIETIRKINIKWINMAYKEAVVTLMIVGGILYIAFLTASISLIGEPQYSIIEYLWIAALVVVSDYVFYQILYVFKRYNYLSIVEEAANTFDRSCADKIKKLMLGTPINGYGDLQNIFISYLFNNGNDIFHQAALCYMFSYLMCSEAGSGFSDWAQHCKTGLKALSDSYFDCNKMTELLTLVEQAQNSKEICTIRKAQDRVFPELKETFVSGLISYNNQK